MTACPMCLEDIAATDAVCPHCGHVLQQYASPTAFAFAAFEQRPAPAPAPAPAPPPIAQAPTTSTTARHLTWQTGVLGLLGVGLVAAVGAAVVLRSTTHTSPDAEVPALPEHGEVPERSAVPPAPTTPPIAAPAPPPPAPAPPPPPIVVQTLPSVPVPAPARAESESGVLLTPASFDASSFIGNHRRQHAPERAFDGDPATAWNESERGAGAGSWLSASFAHEVVIGRVRITTGWDAASARHGDLFPLNSHLRRVRVTFDGAHAVERDIGVDQRVVVLDDLRERARTVRIDAVDVWAGTSWADLCISEVSIEGPRE